MADICIENAYLDMFTKFGCSRVMPPACEVDRTKCVRDYAWAVPTEDALQAIAKYAPIVELGAGTGYWASLLDKMGVDIVAYDIEPPDGGSNSYRHMKQYFPVLRVVYYPSVDRDNITAKIEAAGFHFADSTLNYISGYYILVGHEMRALVKDSDN